MRMRFCLFALFLFAITACTKKTEQELPALHPVTGKVLNNGKTVARGYVRFTPETNQDYMVQGLVDENGAFELETVRAGKTSKGAPAGVYTVFFNPGSGEQSISAPMETTKTYTIEAKSNELTIDLSAK